MSDEGLHRQLAETIRDNRREHKRFLSAAATPLSDGDFDLASALLEEYTITPRDQTSDETLLPVGMTGDALRLMAQHLNDEGVRDEPYQLRGWACEIDEMPRAETPPPCPSDDWQEATRRIREWVSGAGVSAQHLAVELRYWAWFAEQDYKDLGPHVVASGDPAPRTKPER